jgi:hypothetical protein
VKVGDLVVFPTVDVDTGHFVDHGIGMVVEIYKHTNEYQGVVEVGCELVDVLWPDGDLIHGYIADDFEVINEGR